VQAYRLVQVAGVLSRAPGLPMGDVSRSLTIACYLTREGRLDDEAWRETANQWMTSGWLPQYGPVNGWLARQDDLWVMRVDGEEEEPQWVVTSHLLRPGEYFTLRRPDSGDLVFRVVNVVDLGTEAGDSRSRSGDDPSGTTPSGNSPSRNMPPEGK
jgi:hypothetical protein